MSKKRQALLKWEDFTKNIKKSTPIDFSESSVEKEKRIQRLLSDYDAFMKYYFPKWASCDLAPFHHRYAKKFLGGTYRGSKMIKEPPKDYKIYITRAWARDHAKTTFTQMLLLFALYKGLIRNVVYVSKTGDAADEMIKPIRLQLEKNQRLINDFGAKKSYAQWTIEKFVTTDGVCFRSVGLGESPRGTKEEEARPDCIIGDDCDFDELSRNPTRLDNSWEWMSSALFPTLSIKDGKRFVILNNKIAKDCLLTRAIEKADDHEQIDIYDKNGNVSWAARFTKEECEWMINKIGTHFAQKEYFNNPVIAGKVFKNDWIQWKTFPPLNKYKFLISYLDPSFKNKKTADHKGLVLIGLMKGEYHVYKAYCDIASIKTMIDWHYELYALLQSKNAAAQFFMEEVFLQDLLYDDFSEMAQEKGFPIPIRGDKRKKPDKDARISALSGLFERGKWFFNKAEKGNHHMERLVEQFQLFEPGKNGIPKDGPDAAEGAKHILEKMIITLEPPIVGKRSTKKNRF